MMIRLRSLGQCSIETPAARLGPEAEIVFATALYLAMERGRRVPRPAMARMLWPDASAARAAHCLRQALYRLRSLEVPLSSGRMHVTLPATAVDADYALLFESHGRRGVQDVVERLSGGFLPGYAPAFSEAYTEWLEQQRDTLNSAIRRVLVGEILAKKAIGDWRTVDLLARRCLTLDPLNEEATLALAESAAMHGSKAEALATLDRYLKEIGPEAREIRLPAIALRRRVAENTSHGQKSLLQAPFVGRKADFALLNSALVRAQRSSGSAYLISGEAGIGKTRLIGEFLRSAQLQHLHVVRVNCQSYDDQRPLSAFVDLVPQLLSVPGALGCSPDTMRYLQRIEKHDLTGPQPSNDAREAELLYSNVRRALFDLLDAITAEGCLVIAVEDGHWLDATSWKLLGEVVPWLATRKSLLVLTGRDGDSHFQQRRAAIRQLNHDRLVPLTKEESKELVGAVLRSVERDFAPEFVDWCVATGCGNPYHLQELALHALHDGKSFSAPDSLRSLIAERLSRLPPLCLRVLQACAVLGKYSTLERLEAVLDQRRVDLLDALDALAGSNLIDCEGAHVLSRHDLLSAEALSLLSAASLRLLHRHAAMVLEGEAARSQSASLLWECAEHWQRAGDAQRALQFVRACARHSVEIGLPLQSADLLERAVSITDNLSDRAEVLCELVCSLELSGQWQRLDQTLTALETLRPSEYSCELHTRWELLAIEAQLHYGFDLTAVFARLRRCTEATSAPAVHRVQAATSALIIADNICDREAAHHIHRAVASCLHQGLVEGAPALHYELIYHSCFGDHERAVRAARTLVAEERRAGNLASLARALRHSSEVFDRAGLDRDALEAAGEAYEIADRRKLHSAACAAANLLIFAFLARGKNELAEKWYRVALEQVRLADDPGLMAHTYGSGAEIALAAGRPAEARALIDRFAAAWQQRVHLRGRSRIDTIRFRIKLAEGAEVSEQEIARLLELHEQTRGFGDQDHIPEAILAGFLARGQVAQARALADDYLRNRRDLSSPPDGVRGHLARLH